MAGQTLSEIRALLAAAGLAPRHRYGQNFLVDLNLMRKVVAAAELRPDDVVLEVGCGTGSLTELLLETGVRVVGVEIDRGLQHVLLERLGHHPRFTLVAADVLPRKSQINPIVLQALRGNTGENADAEPPAPKVRPPQEDAANARYKLVANLPYDVATPLIMELLYGEPVFERLVCTIQREVGDRLRASAGTEAYGHASVIVDTLADITPLAILPASVFWPRPKVESLLIQITPRPPAQVAVEDVADFVQLVRRGFQQRRKMLRRLFADWDVTRLSAVFARAGISLDARPEQVPPPAWRALYQAVRAIQGE